MKKIKYFLFLIPVLFLFCNNVNAYTIRTINDTDIDESFILNIFEDTFEDFTLEDYPYIVCNDYIGNDGNAFKCYAFDSSYYNRMQFKSCNSANKSCNYRSDSGYFYYIYVNKNNLTVSSSSDSPATSFTDSSTAVYFYAIDSSFYITYSNFLPPNYDSVNYSGTPYDISYINVLDFTNNGSEPGEDINLTKIGNYITYEVNQSSRIFDILFSNYLFSTCFLILLIYFIFLLVFRIIGK